jgi:flagellar motor switch protein FliM
MIEMLTLSRLAGDYGDAPRVPTRTDAAMVVDMIDAALADFAKAMGEQGAADWSQPYRYAAFIEDPRPLHLMLEDVNYRLLRAEVHLEHGTRQGSITLAVQVQTGFQMDFAPPEADFFAQDTGIPDVFAAEFSDQIAAVPTQLDAVLAQIILPLDRILRLQAGEVLALGGAGLDSIQLQGIDGLALAAGKLGQQRGMRAVRLNESEQRLPDLGTRGMPKPTAVDPSMRDISPEVGFSADTNFGAENNYAAPMDLMQVG